MQNAGQINKAIRIVPVTNYGRESIIHFCNSFDLETSDAWEFVLQERTLSGYSNGVVYRERLVTMRLFCLFILIHSRLSTTSLQDHIKQGSIFLNDLLSLSDINSDILISLELPHSLKVAQLCLESVVGLLESHFKRRSSISLTSNIMESLNLVSNGSNSLNNEDLWISIVTSAVSFSTLLLPHSDARSSNCGMSPLYFEGGIERYHNDIGKFARLGLNLFAVALATREPQHVLTDIRVLSVIIGILKIFLENLESILKELLSSSIIFESNHQLIQILHVISKCLYCLELTADRQGYLNAFRECEGLQPVNKIIEVFSTFGSQLKDLFGKYPSAANILDIGLSVLHVSIQKHRHSLSIGGVNIAESGHRLAYGPAFLSLGKYIFQNISAKTLSIWVDYIQVLKEAVDIEPTFLGVFLSSDVASAMKHAFTEKLPFRLDPRLNKLQIETLYIPLTRFLVTICITNESKSFIVNSGMISFIIEGIHHDNSILPNSGGLSADRISKVGKLFAQLIIDQESVKTAVAGCLKSKLVELSITASIIAEGDGLELSSPRMNALQKLNNLCILLDGLFSENRRQLSDVAKEIVNSCVPQLLQLYPKTLPGASQLFSQMSLRTNQNSPQYGFAACSKSVASLLKLALSNNAQLVVPMVFKEIDDCLGRLSTSQLSLKGLDTVEIRGADEEDISSQQLMPAKRGNAVDGHSSINVHVSGILDKVPAYTIISDEQFTTDQKELQRRKHLYSITVSYLNLEWLSSLLVHSFRAIHKSNSTSLITAARDVLRRLFGLFRSSISEITRFAANMAIEKVTQSMYINLVNDFNIIYFTIGIEKLSHSEGFTGMFRLH